MKTAPNPIDLSRGNNKIHKALIWNLPDAITCPGATELCKQVCYAHDAAVLHNNVVPQYRARNLEIAHRSDFRELMIQKLSELDQYQGAAATITFGEHRENKVMPVYRIESGVPVPVSVSQAVADTEN